MNYINDWRSIIFVGPITGVRFGYVSLFNVGHNVLKMMIALLIVCVHFVKMEANKEHNAFRVL